jgi:hypothetical protein
VSDSDPAEETETEPARRAPASRADSPIGASWLNLWTAAGGIAGAAAFVYVIGAAIEAVRLYHAGLPVEQAIALVPKATLVAVAVDELFLPTLAFTLAGFAGVFSARALAHLHTAHRETSDARSSSRSAALQRARWLRKAWPVLLLVVLVVVPWTVHLVAYTIFGVTGGFAAGAISSRADEGHLTRRAELLAIAAIVAAVSGMATLFIQLLKPGPLPVVRVELAGDASSLRGRYVGAAQDAVYVDVDKRLVAIPERLVSRTVISRPPAPQPESSESVLERME